MDGSEEFKIYLEIGKKRTIAAALDWPGWCRSAQDEAAALQALLAYGERYAGVLHSAHIEFQPPTEVTAFWVIERISGNATTDFGVPGLPPASDAMPVNANELRFLQGLLEACCQAFDTAAHAAEGKELRLGPRGGGRNLEEIIHHTQEAEGNYIERLGAKVIRKENIGLREAWIQNRQTVLDSLASAARGELPARGPRGGLHWSPRYFVLRAAWHVLDHAWEIEDRIL